MDGATGIVTYVGWTDGAEVVARSEINSISAPIVRVNDGPDGDGFARRCELWRSKVALHGTVEEAGGTPVRHHSPVNFFPPPSTPGDGKAVEFKKDAAWDFFPGFWPMGDWAKTGGGGGAVGRVGKGAWAGEESMLMRHP